MWSLRDATTAARQRFHCARRDGYMLEMYVTRITRQKHWAPVERGLVVQSDKYILRFNSTFEHSWSRTVLERCSFKFRWPCMVHRGHSSRKQRALIYTVNYIVVVKSQAKQDSLANSIDNIEEKGLKLEPEFTGMAKDALAQKGGTAMLPCKVTDPGAGIVSAYLDTWPNISMRCACACAIRPPSKVYIFQLWYVDTFLHGCSNFVRIVNRFLQLRGCERAPVLLEFEFNTKQSASSIVSPVVVAVTIHVLKKCTRPWCRKLNRYPLNITTPHVNRKRICPYPAARKATRSIISCIILRKHGARGSEQREQTDVAAEYRQSTQGCSQSRRTQRCEKMHTDQRHRQLTRLCKMPQKIARIKSIENPDEEKKVLARIRVVSR
ncbi:unnamed protein product [Trichogramma brassicae]|uniref:Uncharacterized protein n=1 Tax=Trichogramma brassicae TaxID=86971 RepID=A0A6H5IPB1_9HYME|nr:unnamed protein product [Trichogramma brassicae]